MLVLPSMAACNGAGCITATTYLCTCLCFFFCVGASLKTTSDAAAAAAAAAKRYDYIIVGGGTAGCALAATLSADRSVLVIERGGSPYAVPEVMQLSGLWKLLYGSGGPLWPAQTVLTEDGVQLLRARVLGGGSAINAGFYSRAEHDFVARIMGLDQDLVEQSYEWVEERLLVSRPPKLSRWSLALLDGLLQSGVLPFLGFSLDHPSVGGGTKISGSIFDDSGLRHSAADLLADAEPRNIVVLLNSTVSRILLHHNGKSLRAVGVELVDSQGTTHQAFLDESMAEESESEVILSAGAMGSPQLLMLSGIGPKNHLNSLNITCLLHLPWVGQEIQDNPNAVFGVESPLPLEESSIQVVGILNFSFAYIESSSFTQTQNSSSSGVKYFGGIMQKLSRPLSRGTLRLRSRDATQNPSVQYNYYSHPSDIRSCARAARIMARIAESEALAKFKFKGESRLRFSGSGIPASSADKSEMMEFCRRTLGTMWHFHGGCEPGKVVDYENYVVLGTSNLRIVDGSLFRHSPGTNPQATTMMLGRYMGLKMRRERSRSAKILGPKSSSSIIEMVRNVFNRLLVGMV